MARIVGHVKPMLITGNSEMTTRAKQAKAVQVQRLSALEPKKLSDSLNTGEQKPSEDGSKNLSRHRQMVTKVTEDVT